MGGGGAFKWLRGSGGGVPDQLTFLPSNDALM